MGKNLDGLVKFEDFTAPWETAGGTDSEIDKPKLRRYIYNLLKDKATHQDATLDVEEKVKTLTSDLDEARKGDNAAKVVRLEKELEKAKADLTTSEVDRMRLEVGIEAGLTPKQAARLRGSTKEELEADAEDLAESFGLKEASANNDGDDGDDGDEDGDDAPTLRKGPVRTNLVNGSRNSGDGDLSQKDIDALVASGDFDF